MPVVSVSYLYNKILYHGGSNKGGQSLPARHKALLNNRRSQKGIIYCHSVPHATGATMKQLMQRKCNCCWVSMPSRLAGIGTRCLFQASNLVASSNDGQNNVKTLFLGTLEKQRMLCPVLRKELLAPAKTVVNLSFRNLKYRN